MRGRALAAGMLASAAPPAAAIFHHRTPQPTPPPRPPPTPHPNPAPAPGTPQLPARRIPIGTRVGGYLGNQKNCSQPLSDSFWIPSVEANCLGMGSFLYDGYPGCDNSAGAFCKGALEVNGQVLGMTAVTFDQKVANDCHSSPFPASHSGFGPWVFISFNTTLDEPIPPGQLEPPLTGKSWADVRYVLPYGHNATDVPACPVVAAPTPAPTPAPPTPAPTPIPTTAPLPSRLLTTISQADALVAVDLNAAGTLAAFGGEGGKVYLHTVDAAANATASLATLEFPASDWRVDSVALNAAGTVLAVARGSVHLYVIDPEKGVVHTGSTFPCPGGNPGDGAPQVATSVALNGEGTLLALSCGCTGSSDYPFAGVYTVNPSTAEVGPAHRANVPSESNGELNAVALSRDARDGSHVLAVGGQAKGAHLHTVDAANATISQPSTLASPVADHGSVISVALSADGSFAAVGAGVKHDTEQGHAVVATYSFPPGAQLATLQATSYALGFGGFAEAMALDAAGESLAVGIGGPAGGGSTVMFSVRPSNGYSEYVTQLAGPQTQAVAFNKAGSLLACATHTSHPGLQLWVR